MKKKLLIMLTSLCLTNVLLPMQCFAEESDEAVVAEDTDEDANDEVVNDEEEDEDVSYEIEAVEVINEAAICTANVIYHSSSLVTLDNTDSFCIVLTNINSDTNEELNVTFSENGSEIAIPEGEYRISDITYTGTKNNFDYVGIATNSYFDNDGINSYSIYVGYEVIQNASQLNEELYIKQAGKTVNLDELQNYDPAYDEEFTDNAAQEKIDEDNQANINQKIASLRWAKLRILVVMFVITIGITLVMIKTGKINVTKKVKK